VCRIADLAVRLLVVASYACQYINCHGLHTHPPSLPLSSSVDLNELPDGDAIAHIQQLGSHVDDLMGVDSSNSETTGKPVKLQPPVLISNSLPLVPVELVQRVEEGLFIEMAELSPNALDSADLNMKKWLRSPKHLYVIPDIVEWVQCFGIYVAIVSCSKPAHVSNLIGYQSLIICRSLPKLSGG